MGFLTEVLGGIPLINSGGGHVQRKIDGAGQTEGCKSRVWFLKPLGDEETSSLAFGSLSRHIINGGNWKFSSCVWGKQAFLKIHCAPSQQDSGASVPPGTQSCPLPRAKFLKKHRGRASPTNRAKQIGKDSQWCLKEN